VRPSYGCISAPALCKIKKTLIKLRRQDPVYNNFVSPVRSHRTIMH
jgi:hypothetical protein